MREQSDVMSIGVKRKETLIMKRIIIFLIRKRLGLKKEQHFRFPNQRLKEEYYYFTKDKIMKCNIHGVIEESTVSLNWLLDDKCEIDVVNIIEVINISAKGEK